MPSLAGIKIVVTRAAHQAEELAAPLRALGAEVLLLPLIGIAPPFDPMPLRAAAARCASYDWILFTSANGVKAFSELLSSPCRAAVAAVGKATCEAAERLGFRVRLVPERYVAEALLEALSAEDLRGKRILIPSAAETRDVLPGALEELGARVEVVTAYRNVIPEEAVRDASAVLSESAPDWATFASSSAVEHAVQLAGTEVLARMKIASIGPITSASLRKHGLSPHIEAQPHSIEGLVQSILQAPAFSTSTRQL